MSFLDKTGLSQLWSKCKAHFAPKVHSHNDLYYTESEIDSLLENVGGGVEFATLEEVQSIIDSYVGVDRSFVAPTLVVGNFRITITNNDSRSATFYSQSANGGEVSLTNFENQTTIASGETSYLSTGFGGNYQIKAYADDGTESEIYIVNVVSSGGGYQ